MGLVPALKEKLHYHMTHSNHWGKHKATWKKISTKSFAEINLRLQVRVDIGATVNGIGVGPEM